MEGLAARLPEQPIFYPVTSQAYAERIARDWNSTSAAAEYRGYVTRSNVLAAFLGRYYVQTVGSSRHREYWILAEELDELNRNIVGPIEVIAEYRNGKKLESE